MAKQTKKKRAYLRRSDKEKADILRAYDNAERGTKAKVLEKHGVTSSHIASWKRAE